MSRRGFTLIELLVAIGIISILIGLTIPAVQRAREAARRISCRDHLRQFGLAFELAHEKLGHWPPAVVWSPAGEPLGGGVLPIGVLDRVALTGKTENDTIYANWAIELLPYLEQEAVYEQFDRTAPISAAANEPVRTAELAVLKCPSDPYNEIGAHFHRGAAMGLRTNRYARGNYAINVGPDNNCLETPDPGEGITCVNGFLVRGFDVEVDVDQVWGRGVAGVNKTFGMNDVKDGASNTIMLDEIRAGLNRFDPRGVWALGQVGSSAIARHGKFGQAPGPNFCLPGLGDEFIGCTALTENLGEDVLDRECMGCSSGNDPEANIGTVARSLHPGGLNVLYCDGSSHFIQNGIDVDVWHALHTRNASDGAGSEAD